MFTKLFKGMLVLRQRLVLRVAPTSVVTYGESALLIHGLNEPMLQFLDRSGKSNLS